MEINGDYMSKIKNTLAIATILIATGSIVEAMIPRPVNNTYNANISILHQFLEPIDATQPVTINMIQQVLQQLEPQNLNHNINGGNDLFNSNSQIAPNGHQLAIGETGITRADQLRVILDNVSEMCEQGNNQLVWQAVYGRATQLLHSLQNGAFGNNVDENFTRLEYELHSLVNINQVVANNYLNPQ